jgi:crossover junction endodeoxyribonuclease RusA
VTTVLNLFIPGTPKPKGSLRHVGHGRLIEQLAGSPDWRATVRAAVYEQVRCCPDPTCGHLQPGYPNPHALAVTVTLLFAKPKSAPKTRPTLPITRSTGDVDKQARNILDALVDAGVMRDDSQVIDLTIRKRYCPGGRVPGAHIEVRETDPKTPGGGAASETAASRDKPARSVAGA